MGRTWVFLFVIVTGVTADLWTKSAAFESVPERSRHEVVDGFFYIAPIRNPGAMWSFFQDVPAWAWVIIRGSIATGLLVYYWRNRNVPLWVHMAYAMVLAGALGNLHDNMWAFGGMVRDFIQCVFWGWPFPTFNVADSMICVGAILLLWHFFWLEDPTSTRSASVREVARDRA